jgi:hypothetical protein
MSTTRSLPPGFALGGDAPDDDGTEKLTLEGEVFPHPDASATPKATIKAFKALGYTKKARRWLVERTMPAMPTMPAWPSAGEPFVSGETSDEIIIPGGVDVWGRRHDDFRVGAAHTLYEWALLFEDRHPGELHDAHLANTGEDRRWREDFLGGGNDKASISRAVYDELAVKVGNTHRKVEAGKIQQPPLWQFVYRADEPVELDLTLCVIDIELVLAIARRRKDHGQIIARLLATQDDAAMPPAVEPDPSPAMSSASMRPAPEAEIHIAIGAVYDKATKPPNLKQIAAPVQEALAAAGYEASGRHIQQLAGQPQHAGRRRKPGATLAKERGRH